MILLSILTFVLCTLGVAAKTHTYDFNVTYVNANPDGLYERRVVGINNQWPLPLIKVRKHDRVVINLRNELDVDTSLHFHGLFQKGSNAMDGPQMVTQCPIAPKQTFLYNFTVDDQVGTYWYHSHSGAQYGDGLRGMFIIESDDFTYDEETTLTVSDWYHQETSVLMKSFLSRYNPTGAEPVPQSSLFNDSKAVKWSVKPDTTYLLRIANVGLFASQLLYIEGHNFTIVEADGVAVKPQVVDSLYISVAQRYSVLVHTHKDISENFRFVNIIDQDMLDVLPPDLELVSTSWVVYDEDKELPKPLPNDYDKAVGSINPFDDFNLKPVTKDSLFEEADYRISLNFTMENLGDGVQYALFNKKSYVAPKVPTLMSVFSGSEFATDNRIYGSNTNAYVLQKDEVVEIVLNNMDSGKHPFHLHGHNFQIVSRSEEGEDDDNPIVYDPHNPDHIDFPGHPMIRDTVLVNSNGFVVLRFKADNPGVWFFHCHVDWHLEQGLAITLIEAPLEIQTHQSLPQNHIDNCIAANVGHIGNAAANFGDSRNQWLNLTGENVQVAPLPEGFTAKGYIAFVLCSVFAIVGIYSIYDYGMQDLAIDDTDKVADNLYAILNSYESERNGYVNPEGTNPENSERTE